MVTRAADFEGVPCYLESSKAVPNVAIYRKMGFEFVREVKSVDGDDVCTVCRFLASRFSLLVLSLRMMLTGFSFMPW